MRRVFAAPAVGHTHRPALQHLLSSVVATQGRPRSAASDFLLKTAAPPPRSSAARLASHIDDRAVGPGARPSPQGTTGHHPTGAFAVPKVAPVHAPVPEASHHAADESGTGAGDASASSGASAAFVPPAMDGLYREAGCIADGDSKATSKPPRAPLPTTPIRKHTSSPVVLSSPTIELLRVTRPQHATSTPGQAAHCSAADLEDEVSSLMTGTIPSHDPMARDGDSATIATSAKSGPMSTTPSVKTATVSAVPSASRLKGSHGRPLLCTSHPAFGQQEAIVPDTPREVHPDRRRLSTDHPAFGTVADDPRAPEDRFAPGPVLVGGFFFSVDPNLCLGDPAEKMNPNALLTIKDTAGNAARAKYNCALRLRGNTKVECLVRCQVGWISPRATFKQMPHKIHLGRGFDMSIPLIAHFTMANILDEHGNATGSSLYFSGTPLCGFSCGFAPVTGGELVLDPAAEADIDPEGEGVGHFIGKFHYRQLGFLVFKAAGYVLCALAVVLPVQEIIGMAKAWVWAFVTGG